MNDSNSSCQSVLFDKFYYRQPNPLPPWDLSGFKGLGGRDQQEEEGLARTGSLCLFYLGLLSLAARSDINVAVCVLCSLHCEALPVPEDGGVMFCVHVYACMHLFRFSLAGLFPTLDSRGHKSFSEGKSMSSVCMCVCVGMVMGYRISTSLVTIG